MTALALHQASVRVGRKTIVDDVSLAFAPGESVAILGPNGAGKSTIMRMLSGELRPSSGQVTLRERPLTSYGPRALALHRAVLSQSITVAFPFTVAEVVAMGAGEHRGRKVDEMAARALADVDLTAFGDRTITTLSGGEQQRAHFARVLVQLACAEIEHGPGILLLDEPTASLDLRHQLDMARAARACAARGVTVLSILHDLNLASLFADRIVVMHQGRVFADGTPADVITDDTLARVFGVSQVVGRVPTQGVPFVLPHGAMPAGL